MIDSKLNNFIYETPMYDEDCELLKICKSLGSTYKRCYKGCSTLLYERCSVETKQDIRSQYNAQQLAEKRYINSNKAIELHKIQIDELKRQTEFQKKIDLLEKQITELQENNLKFQEQFEFLKQEANAAKQDSIKSDKQAKTAKIQARISNIITIISVIVAIIALFK